MASLRVSVAAYDSFAAALAAWDEIVHQQSSDSGLIDAALIERFDRRVMALHRCWSAGWARGWVASAVVGKLSPPALLDGALAGGVGRRALVLVSNGLSPGAANQLSSVLDSRRFLIILLAAAQTIPSEASVGARAAKSVTTSIGATAGDLRRAVLADWADE